MSITDSAVAAEPVIEVVEPEVIELVSAEQSFEVARAAFESDTESHARLVIDLDDAAAENMPDLYEAFPAPSPDSVPDPQLFPNQTQNGLTGIDGDIHYHHDPQTTGDVVESPIEASCYNQSWCGPEAGPYHECWPLNWLGWRNSATHGRSIGAGGPLRGTSWLNRPYWLGLDFGGLIMTSDPAQNVTPGNDFLAAIHAGWDWDHYWGSQIRVAWSTPRLDNTQILSEDLSDNLFITDVSILHYPWGDARVRPYLRLGMGLTDLEFTDTAGFRQQELLYTIPLAIGVKYQFRRWLAWRAEFANNLAIGQNNSGTLNNLSLTIGFEGRFGGRPSGYWAWHPRGHGW